MASIVKVIRDILKMSFFGIGKKKLSTSMESTSSVSSSHSSLDSNSGNKRNSRKCSNPFEKFDEKKDYDRRCRMKNSCSGRSHPCSFSFSLA